MTHFLINSAASLFVLWLFYKLALENTSWHHFKRYYLIAAVVIAAVIPFIVVETIIIPVETETLANFTYTSEPATATFIRKTEQAFQVNWSLILFIIYSLGVIIMSWRFIKNIQSFKIKDGDEINTYGKYQLVLRHFITVPHSFFQRIFVSKKQYEANTIPITVLEHEKAHLDQKHSLDILFIEVLLILFWFNPLLYLLRYSIKLNHEFLADRAVINQGINTTIYQETLLSYTQRNQHFALANNFNFPIIKKRFNIMATKTSTTSLLLRNLALIPIIALIIIGCGKKETQYEAQEPQQVEEVQYQVSDVEYTETPSSESPEVKEIVYAEPGEVITPDIFYKGVEFVMYDNAIRYNDTTIGDLVLKKVYEDLTESDKAMMGPLALTVFNQPHTIRIPSASDMEEYLNPKIFRIWIDGEEVPNSKLSDYEITDFKSHSGRMFVHKTGRKTHPQAFNVMFYTPNYYKAKNMDKQVKYYGGKQMITHKNVKRVRKNFKDVSSTKTSDTTNNQMASNGKTTNSSYRIITANEGYKSGASTSTMSDFAEIANESKSEDLTVRRLIWMTSLKQNKALNYELNDKPSTATEIKDYLVTNETANVAFVEGAENTLKFSDVGKDKMKMAELRKVYSILYKNRPNENTQTKYVLVSEKDWKVVTIDATKSEGSFTRNNLNYTYDASDLKNIKVFNDNGNPLSAQEREDLKLGFNPVWVDGAKELKELLSDPKIIQGFKNNEVALFHSKTYTKNYDEALKVDAKDMFLEISNRDDGLWIHLYPHSWANTNPSFHQFKDAVSK